MFAKKNNSYETWKLRNDKNLSGFFLFLLMFPIIMDIISMSNSVMGDEEENEACKNKILMSYPDAKCSLAKDPRECKSICSKYGSDTCKERKGEIKKLYCRKVDDDITRSNQDYKNHGPMTCCCAIKCSNHLETENVLSNVKHKFIINCNHI